MFAGHIGAALLVGRAQRRLNAGLFVGAALLLDVVLWILVLLGWESVTIPADFARTHQPFFSFPYSHGLLASVLWSIAAGALGASLYTRLDGARWRAGALLGAAVFSHWLLDALVHRPELPLVGATSRRVGLGLWDDMPLALVAEALVVLVGLYWFLPGSGLSRVQSITLTLLSLLLVAFTVLGMTIAPPAPSASAMASSSLLTIAVVVALASWSGKRAREAQVESR